MKLINNLYQDEQGAAMAEEEHDDQRHRQGEGADQQNLPRPRRLDETHQDSAKTEETARRHDQQDAAGVSGVIGGAVN